MTQGSIPNLVYLWDAIEFVTEVTLDGGDGLHLFEIILRSGNVWKRITYNQGIDALNYISHFIRGDAIFMFGVYDDGDIDPCKSFWTVDFKQFCRSLENEVEPGEIDLSDNQFHAMWTNNSTQIEANPRTRIEGNVFVKAPAVKQCSFF